MEVVRDGTRIAEVAEPGAVFGELALLLDQPHTADVRTLAPSTFHVADGRTILRVDPTTTLYVAVVLAQRLTTVNRHLVEVRARMAKTDQPRRAVRGNARQHRAHPALRAASLALRPRRWRAVAAETRGSL